MNSLLHTPKNVTCKPLLLRRTDATDRSRSARYFLPLMLCGLFAFAGCGSLMSAPSDATPVVSEMPTLTPVLSPTPVITPTPLPTEAPTEAPTATPVPTKAPLPTPTGTLGEVCFSEAGYLFSEDILLELSIASKKSGYITYTMDGTEPDETSLLYTEPLLLEANSGSFPNAYSIRAKAWYDDGTVSDTYVHTYFVNTGIQDRYTTAIFSINGNPAELTEGPDGILYGTNYKARGAESERVVHIEAVSSDGTLLFSQFAGVRVFGGTSRQHAVKSLKLYARKEYEKGKGTFSTTIFGSTMLDGVTPITKYDKLVLRNGGDDFQLGFIRDELLQRLAGDAGFAAYEAVVPAVAYINGSYYGFYWLHESYCDKYFQYRNGKSDGEYVVLEGTEHRVSGSDDALENAAAKEYNALYKEYAYADLTEDETFAALCTKIDVENYMDYMAYNMYAANYDWPDGNFRCFRYYAAEDEEYGTGEKDGRFRFLLHDCDVGFGTYQSTEDAGAARNDLEQVLGSPNGDRYAPLLAALLKREDCKQYFIDKMLEYMNGALSYDNVCRVLDEMCAERDTELAYYYEHLDTLKQEYDTIYTSTATLERHMERIRSFAEQRPAYMLRYLEEFFHVDLTRDASE